LPVYWGHGILIRFGGYLRDWVKAGMKNTAL
jgi:hypothetical protein